MKAIPIPVVETTGYITYPLRGLSMPKCTNPSGDRLLPRGPLLLRGQTSSLSLEGFYFDPGDRLEVCPLGGLDPGYKMEVCTLGVLALTRETDWKSVP